MKHPLPTVAFFVLLTGVLLAGCSGASNDDAPLPTLAQLPTVPAGFQAVPTQDAAATASSQTNGAATLEGTITQFPIILPGTLEPTALPTVESDFDLETYPDALVVGTKLTLQGTFSTKDPNSGTATLTNSKQQTVNLTVDPFTAMTADKQLVQITGDVIQQPGDPSKTIQVSEIRMVNGSSSVPTATDAQINGDLPTPTQ